MTSSERILAGIISEAEEKAGKIIAEAEKKAEKIIADKKAVAEQETLRIKADAEKKAVLTESSGKSAAVLVVRDASLAKKRQLIENTLNAVVESINGYDDKKYFDCLLGLIKKNSMSANGKVLLSQKDLNRNIEEFKQNISALGLEIETQAAEINGGFILKYNDILINGELSAIVREKRDEILDAVNTALFG